VTARGAPGEAPRWDRRAVWGWALYDFANSAYTTLIVTFIYAVFFTERVAPDRIVGTALWANAVALTAVVVAVSSPFLGALADRGGYRRPLLMGTTAVCVVGVSLLSLAGPGDVALALGLFVASNIAFELSGVFYNSYLPEVAPPDRIGRVSGYGWALGYLGGLLAMGVALFAFIQPEEPWLGVPRDDFLNVRATTVLVGVWFALFSVPMFLWVRERERAGPAPSGPLLGGTVAQLAETFRRIRRYRQIFRLLVARLVYNDGLVTIFAFGPIYASGTFGFTLNEVMLWGLALNATAGLGAFAMGFLDDRIGGKRTILISLVGLTLAATAAVLAQTKLSLWVVGLAVGVFVGPNQAASRSLLGRFVPARKETEFYGFFAFSGKAISFLGPLLLGWTTALFGSQRVGVATIVVFFVVGGFLLLPLDERAGIRAAAEAETQGVR